MVNIIDLYGKFNYSDTDQSILLKINAKPEKILDDVIQVKLVSSENEHQKFAAQLNGYFSCDLNPFESFSLIQPLDKNFGLEYIGLGASLLFFIKTPMFTSNKLDALFIELDKIYSYDLKISVQLKQHLLHQDYLILPYTESLDVFDLKD